MKFCVHFPQNMLQMCQPKNQIVITLKLDSVWMLLRQLQDVLTQPQTKAKEVSSLKYKKSEGLAKHADGSIAQLVGCIA